MMLLGQMPDPPSNTLGTGLGIAAIVLVAGWAVIHWQRDRLRFALMRTALENGVTRFPGIPPYWLVSLRQGVTLVAVGVALCGIGTAAWLLALEPRGAAATAESPQISQPRVPTQAAPGGQFQSHVPPMDRDEEGRPRHPGPPGGGDPQHHPPADDPLGLGPGHRGPPGQGEGEPGRQPRPEPAEPPHERGRRPDGGVQRAADKRDDQRTIGQASIGGGFILALLGMVRIGFSTIEKRFARESDGNSIY